MLTKRKSRILLVATVAAVALLVLVSTVLAVATATATTVSKSVVLPIWHYRADPTDTGLANGWATATPTSEWSSTSLPCMLPYSRYLWLSRTLPDPRTSEDERVLLRFGGMPYHTTYYVNGQEVGTHTGGIESFTFDVTDYLYESGTNRIAIRCENPSATNDIDGLYFKHIGLSYTDAPRIQEPAYVLVKPAVYMEDSIVTTSAATGTVTAQITLNNTGSQAATVSLGAYLSELDESFLLCQSELSVSAPVGTSTHSLSLTVASPAKWSPENPNLYRLRLSAKVGSSVDQEERNIGFKTVEIDEDGFFRLNGERYYLKGTFMGNTVLGSLENGRRASEYYELIDYLKGCGINCLRFLDCVPIPEVLDYCDRIGMLVYSENPMAWHKYDAPDGRTEQLFKDTVIASLKTLRSHPSFAMFGFLNETEVVSTGTDTTIDLFLTAKSGPSWARSYAPDAIFFLSSGRFDGDQSIASASNPGSTTWDAYMGNESADATPGYHEHISNTYTANMGDLHYYPLQPYGATVRIAYNTIDSFAKGVLMSEAGSGSLYDILSVNKNRAANGDSVMADYETQATALRNFYTSYRLDRVFASPEEIFRASEELSALQRERILTFLRRTGNIGGYFMTSVLDGNGLAEGILGEYNRRKSGITDVITEGFADVRFCVTTDKLTYYSENTVNLRVDLSDIAGVLKADTSYTAQVRITGPDGTVWLKSYTTTFNGDPYVMRLCDEAITIPTTWPAGDYTISVEMQSLAVATGKASFQVFHKSELPSLSGKTVYYYSLADNVKTLLSTQGATLKAFNLNTITTGDVVFVGATVPADADLATLVQAAANGAHVVFLHSGTVVKDGAIRSVMGGVTGSFMTYNNWLYHSESVVIDNAVTAGLHNDCLLDTLYYESVYSPGFFHSGLVPGNVSVATLFTGQNDATGARTFHGGYQLATFKKGSGFMTLNALNLLGGVGTPVADTLLCNLVLLH